MEYTKNDLMNLIKKTVFEVTKVEVEDEKVNLLDNKLNIHPVDFLYIFDLLEKELHVQMTDILKKHDYAVMRIDRMSDAITELL